MSLFPCRFLPSSTAVVYPSSRVPTVCCHHSSQSIVEPKTIIMPGKSISILLAITSASMTCSSAPRPANHRHYRLSSISRRFTQAHRHGRKDPAAGRAAGGRWKATCRRSQTAPGSRRPGRIAGAAADSAVISAIRVVLELHNPIEEDPGGMYEQCAELAGAELDKICASCKRPRM